MDFRFRKAERITSLKDIEHLFERGCSSSVNVSPLLAVWQQRPAVTADGRRSVKVLVSVAKKRLRHAVDRNRAKRQIREAYRLHREQLDRVVADSGKELLIAFVWQSDTLEPTERVSEAMRRILAFIAQRTTTKQKFS